MSIPIILPLVPFMGYGVPQRHGIKALVLMHWIGKPIAVLRNLILWRSTFAHSLSDHSYLYHRA